MLQPDILRPLVALPEPELHFSGYCIGAIGRLVELHAQVYHARCGFDSRFEVFVAKELADFIEHFDPRYDGLWLCKQRETIIGCVAIDGHEHGTDGGRLRFLIVDPQWLGHGIGYQLMEKAISFCKGKSMPKIFLWTTPALLEARRLYEKFGFVLVDEVAHEDWGNSTTHQRFELMLSP